MEDATYKVKVLDLDFGRYQVILTNDDAADLGLHPGDRVKVVYGEDEVTAILETTDTVVERGTVGVFLDVQHRMELHDGDLLRLRPAEKPLSVQYIKKKMRGRRLGKEEIDTIIRDTVDGTLSDVELAAWVTSLEIHDMDMAEVESLTRSMVHYGEVLDFDNEVVFDKHSIGGVPGNKITLLIVPMVAAHGLLIPKTSSRAVTGAAGTADVMEVFGPVNLNAAEIKRITKEVGGVMCWGGGVNLAPADDIIIRVEHPLSIDPASQLLASVMAKKKAVGADKVVMDLPTGEGTKLPDIDAARKLARKFMELGERLDMDVECAVTYGGQPVGKAIGCAVEANEALMALRGDDHAPRSLIEKSAAIAGMLLEMGGVVGRGKGKRLALDTLADGRAYQKFVDIVQAQGGKVPDGHIPVGKYTTDITIADGGYVSAIDNRALVQLARAAGAPRDKGAGVLVHAKRGDKVEPEAPVLTVYAESEPMLHQAATLARRLRPIHVEGMLLQRLPEYADIR